MICRVPYAAAENYASTEREALNRRPVLLAVAVATATVLPAFLTGGLAVQVRGELDFGAAALGLTVAAFFACSSVTSAVMGRVVELIGSHRGMRLAALGSATSLLGVALLARSWTGLVGCLVLGAWRTRSPTPRRTSRWRGRSPPGARGCRSGSSRPRYRCPPYSRASPCRPLP